MKRLVIWLCCLALVGFFGLANAQKAHIDPPSLQVMSAEKPIIIDGKLDETDWQRRIFALNFKHQYKPDDVTFAVTGEVMPPEPEVNGSPYDDVSSAQMMFLHRGTDLYFGLISTDSSVCKRFCSWEGDGIFMKIKDKAGNAIEYKLFYINPEVGASAKYETSGNAPAGSGEGKSYEFPGTVANKDTTKTDAGYTLEMVIHLDKLGYTADDTEIPVAITVFDLDYITACGTPSKKTADFYKSWWGSEWGTEFRTLILSDPPVVEALATTKSITLDGKLDEAEWAGAKSIYMKPGSAGITGWWYMQWGDTLNSYDDPSGSTVKFLHKGTDVYIGITSDDKSVTNYASGWEADGAFIWMRDPFTVPDPGQRQEIKLMYFGADVGKPAVFEVSGTVPTGGAEGASYEFPGTVTRTETNGEDKGYSLEIVIHADKWGYVATDTVWFGLVLWDMDKSSADANLEHEKDYAKTWWGSEWADKNFDKFYMYRGIVLSTKTVSGEPPVPKPKPHTDPPSLQVMSAEKPIVIDGKLNETDWQRRIFALNFKHQYKPDDVTFAVTGEVMPPEPEVNGSAYDDVSSAQMMFLHRGTDLYFGLISTDSSVCKRFCSWEGDGIFMKVKDKAGNAIEYKLFYVDPAVGASAKFETSGNAPAGSGEGKSYEFPGTVANKDTTKTDAGYTLEMVIHLDKLGYTADDTNIPVAITVFDLDYITACGTPSKKTADFYKSWWGSEWGTEFRTLILSDPPVVEALTTKGNITLDGKLDEPDWAGAKSIFMKPGSKGITGWWYMQWGDTLNSYDDPSGSTVKFLHKGTDVYIGIVSDDKSVTNYAPGWEADGAFIWMRDPFTVPDPGQRQEIKLMYFGTEVGKPAVFEVNANVPTGGAEGVSYEFPGTVTRTKAGDPDKGYSMEIVIHADKWGYTATDTVWFGLVLWDMDHSSVDDNDEHNRDYGKTWWGSEWADKNFDKFYMYRGIVLSSASVTPPLVIFDEDDPIGAGYYDASWGNATAPSQLELAGPGKDKLIIDSTHVYAGKHAGKIRWNHAAGGDWMLFIASIGWKAMDATNYDSLVFHVNAPAGAENPGSTLPNISLEDASNNKASAIPLGNYLAAIDADTTTWQRVSIPLSAFKPYGQFSLAKLKDAWFSKGPADGKWHQMWVDQIMVVPGPGAVGVQERPNSPIPMAFRLLQNFPNPFNPETKIQFAVPVTSIVKIEIFNMLGQRVRELHYGLKPAGAYSVIWDGRDDAGRQVGSGVYLYRLSTDRFTATKKMLLVR
ncbi:MAG: T9SS type A sorting domain-containing protein [candidate division KSB1 bacterium]|nr:T9SS type A sorting domain-containing protein [candidate division KSB1 bacterium]MDZ7300996.1 T9SS type A sorting domain-containing protein [candidate division KSB1 bacterium]MDZ7310325.1 T9SS type A sorting domain-containing protein [candidate division KSB1 bacterium]